MADHRLLGVFAHPDDECYGPGGAFARYAAAGVETHILCFTCGEAGSIGVSSELPGDELCRLRRKELADACEALGVASHRIVGAPDKGVGALPEPEVVGEILAEFERVRPQVVLTFHRGGVSGHPDHIAVAGHLETAVSRAGDAAPLRHYQWGIPHELRHLYDRPNLVPMEDDDVAAVLELSDDEIERKIAAIEKHATQIEFLRGLQADFDYRTIASREFYSLQQTSLPRPKGVVSDLFQGVPGWSHE